MVENLNKKIGFIGAGNMAEAFIRGLLNAELCLVSDISVSDVRRDRLELMQKNYGVNIFLKNVECVEASELIVIAVKPQNMADLLHELSGFKLDGKMVLSIVAGFTLTQIEDALRGDTAVVRVMPNTPVLIGEGVSVWSRGRHICDEGAERAKLILGSLGKELEVKEELMNAATAISGSGPAYVFYLLEAMVMAAVKLGFTEEQASLISEQTLIGAGYLAERSKQHPQQLRRQVTSPGGTTAAAIRLLEERKVKEAFVDAIDAACKKASELSRIKG